MPLPLEAVEKIRAQLFAVILDFNQVRLRGADGHQYAVTRHTEGVTLSDLREGQMVDLVVTRHLHRVLSAQVVG